MSETTKKEISSSSSNVKDAIKSLNDVANSVKNTLISIDGVNKEELNNTEPHVKDDYIIVNFSIDTSVNPITLTPTLMRSLADALENDNILSKITISNVKFSVAVRTK